MLHERVTREQEVPKLIWSTIWEEPQLTEPFEVANGSQLSTLNSNHQTQPEIRGQHELRVDMVLCVQGFLPALSDSARVECEVPLATANGSVSL